MPASATVCGLDGSLSAMFSVAPSMPTIEGVNLIWIAQVPLTGIDPVQLEDPIAKSAAFVPEIETLEMDSEPLVRFASVTAKGLLLAPTTTLPRWSVAGLMTTPVAAAGDSFARKAEGAL